MTTSHNGMNRGKYILTHYGSNLGVRDMKVILGL